jgi:hypothetical protein
MCKQTIGNPLSGFLIRPRLLNNGLCETLLDELSRLASYSLLKHFIPRVSQEEKETGPAPSNAKTPNVSSWPWYSVSTPPSPMSLLTPSASWIANVIARISLGQVLPPSGTKAEILDWSEYFYFLFSKHLQYHINSILIIYAIANRSNIKNHSQAQTLSSKAPSTNLLQNNIPPALQPSGHTLSQAGFGPRSQASPCYMQRRRSSIMDRMRCIRGCHHLRRWRLGYTFCDDWCTWFDLGGGRDFEEM